MNPQQVNQPQINQPSLSQDEMKSNLDNLFKAVGSKLNQVKSSQFDNNKKVMEGKSKILRKAFDILSSSGIDPSNREQVALFLNKIKEQNPAVSSALEKALESMLK